VTPGGAAPSRADVVALEEPLEIRVAGDTVAITMRTPGADHALAAGFLLSEGIVHSVDDLGTRRGMATPWTSCPLRACSWSGSG